MSRKIITHRGVPLGSVSIGAAIGIVTAEFHPLPEFDELRALVVDVGTALRAAGFFGRDAADGSGMVRERRSAVLEAGASWGRDLELRGEFGELVPTSFIEIGAVPDESPPLYVAWIGFERLAAAVPAEQTEPQHSESAAVQPG